MLGTLFKDERSSALPTHTMLSKVHLRRILRPHDVAAFASQLRPHQLAVGGDGLTVLERSVIEHNLASCSQLYNNIRLDELGTLLGISGPRAEKIAATMICEGRLKGSIDQVDGLLFFEGDSASGFDSAIVDICQRVQAAVEQLPAIESAEAMAS